LNPRTPSGQGLKPCLDENGEIVDYNNIRENFIKWLKNRTSEDYTRQLIRYLDRFVRDIPIQNSEEIIRIIESSTSKKNIILALRNLVNYCEETKVIGSEKANEFRKVLKCVRSNPDGYTPSDEEVRMTFKRFDDGEYRIVFKVLAFSGLRIREAVKMLNNFNKSRLMMNGDIAKYPLFNERITKKAYFAYMPKEFALELKKMNVTEQGVKKYFSRRGLAANI